MAKIKALNGKVKAADLMEDLIDAPIEEMGGESKKTRRLTLTGAEQTKTKHMRVVVAGNNRGCGTTAMADESVRALLASQFDIPKVKPRKSANIWDSVMNRAYILQLGDTGGHPSEDPEAHLYGLPPKCFSRSIAGSRKLSGLNVKGMNDQVVRSTITSYGPLGGYYPLLAKHPGKFDEKTIETGGVREMEWYMERRLTPSPLVYIHKPAASGVTYGKTGGAVPCCVPHFRNWYTELFLSYEEGGLINQATLLSLLETAGKSTGVGANRTHGYGRFTVDRDSVVEMPDGWMPVELELVPETTHNVFYDVEVLLGQARNSPVKPGKAKKGKKADDEPEVEIEVEVEMEGADDSDDDN